MSFLEICGKSNDEQYGWYSCAYSSLQTDPLLSLLAHSEHFLNKIFSPPLYDVWAYGRLVCICAMIKLFPQMEGQNMSLTSIALLCLTSMLVIRQPAGLLSGGYQQFSGSSGDMQTTGNNVCLIHTM